MCSYYVYILASRKNGTLYVGVTNDLVRRVYEHREGAVDGFTRRYGVKMLVHFEAFDDVRVLHDASIAVALTKHLTLRTTLNLYYDSRPPDNVEDLDFELRNGLQVRF